MPAAVTEYSCLVQGFVSVSTTQHTSSKKIIAVLIVKRGIRKKIHTIHTHVCSLQLIHFVFDHFQLQTDPQLTVDKKISPHEEGLYD